MENETEVIREQMEETRTALTEKLEALEEQVASTVQGATATVTETVQAVTDTVAKASESVEHTIDKVSESMEHTIDKVKESFDLTQHVQDHPWLMMGGAVAVGFVAGQLLPSASSAVQTVSHAMSGNGHGVPSTASSVAATGSDWLSGLSKAFAPALKDLEGLAIGALAGAVGDMVLQSTPQEYRSHVREVIDNLTTSLGGTLVNRVQPPL